MRSNQRYEFLRCRISIARCVAIIIGCCAAGSLFDVAGAAGAHAGSTAAEQNQTSRAPLREQIKSLLVEGNEQIVAAMLDVHLAAHPDDALMQYNAACVQARLGQIAEAEQRLRAAIKLGFLQFSIMKRDPDLAPLHDSVVYQSIMAARDAADNLITDRRNTHWLDELQGNYHLTRDIERKIDVISSAHDDAVAEIMARIAEIADVEAQFFEIALRHRITIVLLNDSEAERIFGSTNIRGNYRHEMRELVVSNVGRSLQHELAHAFHHTQMDALGQDHPIWVQEGLACLFEAYRVADDGTLEFLPNDRQAAMRYILQSPQTNALSMNIRELMRCSEDRFKQDAPVCYPMARSVFEYVAATADINEWYKEYIAHFNEEPTGEAALVHLCATPLYDVETNWRQWVVARDVNANVNVTNIETIRVVSQRRRAEDVPIELPGNADAMNAVEPTVIVINERDAKASTMYHEIRPLVLAGRYVQAMPALRDLLALYPEHGDARFDLALAHIKQGDIHSARSEYEQLRSINDKLAAMVLACLDRPMRVAARPVVDHAAAQAANATNGDFDGGRLEHSESTLPAPAISCEEMRY